MKLYQAIARTIQWKENIESDKKSMESSKYLELLSQVDDKIEELEKELPHGSGIDGIIRIDTYESSSSNLVIDFEYHFMNPNGFYEGWFDFSVIVTPSLVYDFEMKIIGEPPYYYEDEIEIKDDTIIDYFYELFEEVLREEVV